MTNLKAEIDNVISKGIFNVRVAKYLNSLKWQELTISYPDNIKNEIETFFLFITGLIEEVEEGFVDDEENDLELLKRAKKLFEQL